MLAALRPAAAAVSLSALVAGFLAGCATVVETGPDATAGKGFQEVVVDAPSTLAPTSSGPTTTGPGAPATTATGTAAPATSGSPAVTSAAGGLVFAVGDCLTWDPAATSVQFVVVDCDESHLVEVAGKGDLSAEFAPSAPYPDAEALSAAVSAVCAPVVDTYLAGVPADSAAPGVIPPSETSWAAGDRVAWCTVGLPRVDDRRQPYTGRLADR